MFTSIRNIISFSVCAIAFCLAAFPQSVLAQSPACRVMTARNASVMVEGAEWKSLRCGVQLQPTDQVKVEAGGMAILVHTSGKTIEVKNPGTFTVSSLLGKAQNTSGVAGKFAGYVMDELTKGDKKDARFQQNMMFTGATSKMSNSTNKLCLDSPNFTHVVGNKVTLAWKFCDDTPKFETMSPQAKAENTASASGAAALSSTVVLTITDSLDTPVRTDTLEATTFSIDTKSLEKGKLYKWRVHLKSKPRVNISDNSFRILPEKDAKQIESESTIIRKELGDGTAWSDIVTASFYEQNKLYGLALVKYKAALKRDPSVPEYQQLYAKCLERAGMSK